MVEGGFPSEFIIDVVGGEPIDLEAAVGEGDLTEDLKEFGIISGVEGHCSADGYFLDVGHGFLLSIGGLSDFPSSFVGGLDIPLVSILFWVAGVIFLPILATLD